MKKIFSFFWIAWILICSCTKQSATPSTANNNNGENNNGVGGNGNNSGNSLAISSISPSNPYPDDEITITGKGFDPDSMKDTVEFGRMVGNNFGPWHDGLESEWASLATIVSASATQLVIKSVNPFALDYSSFNSSTSSIAVMQVRAGGKKAVSSMIPFKRLLVFGGITNPDHFNSSIGRPNDSLVITGKGFSKIGLHVSIGSTELTSINIDSTSSSTRVTTRLSKGFFGDVNDETLMDSKTITIVNADGKSVTKDFSFLLSPLMIVSSIAPDQPTYSLSGLSGGGGVAKIYIYGKCLKTNLVVKLTGPAGSNIHSESTLNVSGFPDAATVEYTPNGWAKGNYNVGLWVGNTWYGACSFQVVD